MLPAGARLRRRRDFSAVLRAGHRAASRSVIVHVSRQGGPKTGRTPEVAQRAAPPGLPARVGFAVGRGVGPAVTRNLVKRRLRHLMRDRVHGLPAGTDLVVRARPGAGARSYAELGLELDHALSRIAGTMSR